MQFLKPGGKMAIVLPEHLMKGKNGLFVRKWLYGIAWIKAIFFFPEEAFTPYGAMVKTCLCILQKVCENGMQSDYDDVFLCEIENLGYEATGKLKDGSEVDVAIKAFKEQVGWV